MMHSIIVHEHRLALLAEHALALEDRLASGNLTADERSHLQEELDHVRALEHKVIDVLHHLRQRAHDGGDNGADAPEGNP